MLVFGTSLRSLAAPGEPLYHQPVTRRGVQTSFPDSLAACLLPVAGASHRAGLGRDASKSPPVPGTGCISSWLLRSFLSHWLQSTWAPPWQWWWELHSPWDHPQLTQVSTVFLRMPKGQRQGASRKDRPGIRTEALLFPWWPKPKRRVPGAWPGVAGTTEQARGAAAPALWGQSAPLHLPACTGGHGQSVCACARTLLPPASLGATPSLTG